MLNPAQEAREYKKSKLKDCQETLKWMRNKCRDRGKKSPPEFLKTSVERTLSNGFTRLTLTFEACSGS